MASIDEVLSRLDGVKRAGAGWVARCPSHEDHRQSLGVSVGDDGRVLVNCYAGCAVEDVCSRIGLSVSELFADAPNGNGHREIGELYDYVDEHGELLYQVVRFVPKDFRQRKPDGAGGWAWRLGDVRRVLYKLPEVLAAVGSGEVVYVAEGEKDVHALERAGVVATCNAGGAGKWRVEYSEALVGASVVIVADKDEPGRKHAAQVAAALDGVATSVRIVEAAVGKDAADHLAAGKTVDEFVAVGQDEIETPAASPYVNWSTFWDTESRVDDWAYQDILARGRGHAIYAVHKAGKSLLSLYMAAAISQREGMCCIYLDYEMTEDDLRERLEAMDYGRGTDFSRFYYALLPTLPPLDSESGGAELMTMVDGVGAANPGADIVVIVDTISRAVHGEENDADTWRGFYIHTGLRLKQRGVTWLRLDHSGKDAERGQRGSSSKGDDVDVVWKLKPTEDGVMLKRELARMNWVPETVTLSRQDFPLRYVPVVNSWPEGTASLANLLDRLGLPLNVTNRDAGKRLREVNEHTRNDRLAAALKWRRERAENEPRRPVDNCGEHVGEQDFEFPWEQRTGTSR